MKSLLVGICRCSIVPSLLVGLGMAAAWAQIAQPILPRSMSISTEPVITDTARYQFDVVLSDYRFDQGQAQMRLTVSIVKQSGAQSVRIRDIVQVIAPDTSTVSVIADGLRFALDARYPESPDQDSEVRWVTTTFGRMFSGGRVGILARMAE